MEAGLWLEMTKSYSPTPEQLTCFARLFVYAYDGYEKHLERQIHKDKSNWKTLWLSKLLTH